MKNNSDELRKFLEFQFSNQNMNFNKQNLQLLEKFDYKIPSTDVIMHFLKFHKQDITADDISIAIKDSKWLQFKDNCLTRDIFTSIDYPSVIISCLPIKLQQFQLFQIIHEKTQMQPIHSEKYVIKSSEGVMTREVYFNTAHERDEFWTACGGHKSIPKKQVQEVAKTQDIENALQNAVILLPGVQGEDKDWKAIKSMKARGIKPIGKVEKLRQKYGKESKNKSWLFKK
ncbi:hypothetical protein SS50377_20929 [Spironucleus salmonicida]|uniref:Uncharacterized protein n=1 Tax=Spironucleus salmonicida TaxID=348837 RepID=V6LGE8_9EUKA|nr:hypothetical protein SS50377_20929 [Spironucleus salmonicida]|eukprot:EST43602.1 Hypothetical protein SS50377_16644 [Spironucleus salmonicida]